MSKTNLHQQIFIDALPTKVWKVLTHCDYVNQYLLDGTVRCQWIEGSPILVVCNEENKTQSIQKGKILEVAPGVLLKYKLEEDSGKTVTVTHQLIPAQQGIELKYDCEGFSDTDETYLFRVQQTKILLQKIKWLAEYT